MDECYMKAQITMNKRADELVARTIAEIRRISPKEKALYSPEILQSSLDAAQKMNESQVAWRTYRDQYCNSIRSYVTGSGSGSAMEECLYRTALTRVRQLQRDFPEKRRLR
jgi:uncharacterized protein YecT (DUF1311 family)